MKKHQIHMNPMLCKQNVNYNRMLIKAKIIFLAECCKERTHYVVVSNHF